MTGMKRAVILAALLWVAAISSGPAASAQQTAVADLVIRNGKVVTLSGVGDGAPEAQAVAIDRIHGSWRRGRSTHSVVTISTR